jgi:ribosomal protein S18 acetylase RimI-like enzyme
MHHDSSLPNARFATADDAAEVVRLACVMFTAMGNAEPDDEWKATATAQYARRVGNDVIGAVVDHPTDTGKLIASAAAVISTNLPTLVNPTGAQAYVQWVATDDAFRRRGYARAVMTKLLEQLDTRGGEVALHATLTGEPLYRSLGFWEGSNVPALRRRSWDPAPGTS